VEDERWWREKIRWQMPKLSAPFILTGWWEAAILGRGTAGGGDDSMLSQFTSHGSSGVGKTNGMGADVAGVHYRKSRRCLKA
jgi:hypothetical protein